MSRRRIVIGLLAIVGILAGLVAAAPALVRGGVGNEAIRSRIAARVSGDASFDRLAVSWSGPQRIEGLVLTDADGRNRVAVDVEVEGGLLALARGPERFDVLVDGRIETALDESGRLTIGDLLAPPAGGGAAASAAGGGSGSDRGRPDLAVELRELAVDVDASTRLGGPIVLTKLEGRASLAGSRVAATLASPVEAGGRVGSFDADVSIVVPQLGGGGATGREPEHVRVTLENVGFSTEISGREAESIVVESLVVDGAGRLDAQFDLDVRTVARSDANAEAARLNGRFAVDGLRDGSRWDPASAAWDVDLRGGRIPAAIVQPFVASSGVDVTRDVGPWVEITARTGSGDDAGLDLGVRGDHASMTLVADRVSEARDRLEGVVVTFEGRIAPGLVANHPDLPVPVELDDSWRVSGSTEPFAVELPGEGRTFRIGAVRAQALVGPISNIADGPATSVARVGEDRRRLEVHPLDVTVELGASGGLRLGASSTLVSVQDGASASPADLEPMELVLESMGLDATIGAAGELDVTLRSGRIFADHGPLAAPLRLEAFSGTAVRTSAETPLRIDVDPVSLTAGREVVGTVGGSATLVSASAPDGIDGVPGIGSLPVSALWVEASGLEPARLETILGLEAGTITAFASNPIELAATVPNPAAAAGAGPTASLTLREGASNGGTLDLGLSPSGDAWIVRSDSIRWAPSNAMIARLLPADAEAGTDPAGGPSVVVRDVPAVRARLEDVRIPIAVFAGASAAEDDAGVPDVPAAPALADIAARVDLEIDGATVVVDDGRPVRFGPMQARLDAPRLDRPAVRLFGWTDADAPRDEASAPLAVDVRMGDAGLDGTVAMRGLDTAFVESIAGTGDVLASTLGAAIDVRVEAAAFSADSGTMQFAASGPHGRVDGTVRGEDGGWVIDTETPLVARADIHPLLRRRVLSQIQPLFSGVSRSDGPLEITVSSARVPLGGGLPAIEAEFEVRSGRIEIQQGEGLLGIVAMAEGTGGRPLEATLSPIRGRLAGGIVTTDAATLVMNKGATIEFAKGGTIDLAKGTLDYRARMPLRWLGSVFREVRSVADSVTIPMVARGPLASAEFVVDPEFDLGRLMLEVGIGSALERGLDEIFGGGRRGGSRGGGEGDELERAVRDLLRGLGGG